MGSWCLDTHVLRARTCVLAFLYVRMYAYRHVLYHGNISQARLGIMPSPESRNGPLFIVHFRFDKDIQYGCRQSLWYDQ